MPRKKATKAALHKTTHYLTAGQDAFLKRKVIELQRKAPKGREEEITESTVLQGIVSMWMALDRSRKKLA